MSTGIYAIYWQQQDLIYIGQSVRIEERYKEHLYSLKLGTHRNYKVQEAYNVFGLPEHIILEYCTVDLLDTLEILWQKEFNSLKSLDICEAGNTRRRGSKYSIKELEELLEVSLDSSLSIKILQEKTGIPSSTIQAILVGRLNLGLDTSMPLLLDRAIESHAIRTSSRASRGGAGRTICSKLGGPVILKNNITGEVVSISNLKEFSTKYNLDSSHLSKLLKNKAKSVKGWSIQ